MRAPARWPLAPQFFRRPGRVAGHRLLQVRQGGYGLAEAAAHAGLALGRRHQLQGQAGVAAQLLLQPHPHHTAAVAQFAAGQIAQGAGVGAAPQPAPARELPADAPHVLDGGGRQHRLHLLRRAGADVEHRRRRGAARRCCFGPLVGQLGQHLGGGDAHRHRQPQPALHVAAQGLPPGGEIAAASTRPGPVQQAEGLVDRVDLQRLHPLLQHGHQPLAHVGVEGVVGAAHAYPLPLQLALHLEVGLAHGDAEGAGLGAARHDATVVVGEHHQGPADHGRIHHRLAGGIEVVAVDQHDGLATRGLATHHRLWMAWMATPQMRASSRLLSSRGG